MAATTKTCLLAATVLVCISSVSQAAYCNGKPDPNAQPNLNAIWNGAPKFVKAIPNGKLYTAGEGDDELNIVHVWGTPYEMGFAHGKLLTEDAKGLVNGVWSYLELQIEQAINGTVHNIPDYFLKLVADFGLDEALDLTMDVTRKHSGSYFFEEMNGLADATGVDVKKIERIHMVGELTKGSCSMYGAWGSAIASTDSKLMQLRALDWDVDGPFKDYPQITVYHPSPGNGHAFANIGWTGWVGSITGFSSVRTAISEIGVSFPDPSFGAESRFGTPFTFLLRDVLQFDQDIGAIETHITDASRTCDLILGFGDGKSEEFRGLQYSASVAHFYSDVDMIPVNDTWHAKIDNVVYHGMDWLCPAYNAKLHDQIMKYHGNITAENTIRDITATVQTGDLHIAVYDLTNMVLHVANARKSSASGAQMAYDRTFLRLDMNALFAVTAPEVF